MNPAQAALLIGDGQTIACAGFVGAGLVRRIVGGNWMSVPRLGALVQADAVEARNLPQGVIAQLFRAIAGGKPGLASKIGLHTFIDPHRAVLALCDAPVAAADDLRPMGERIFRATRMRGQSRP